MKVLSRYKNKIKLLPQSIDDVWHLSNIIEKGDLVSGLTHRSKERPLDKLRGGKEDKEPVYLSIRVQETEFHEFSNRLRIHGIIEEGTDLGSHHSLNVKIGKDITIKKEWGKYHLERIKEAVKSSKQPPAIIISMDEDETTIAILHQSGIREIAQISSHRSGKMYESKDRKKEYYGKILSKIEYEKTLPDVPEMPLIILGPGFAKEEFLSFGREARPELFQKCLVDNVGQSGIIGIREGIKRGIINRMVKHSRILFERQLLEKFLEEIAKDEMVTYGEREVEEAVKMGAVKELMITNKMLRKKEDLIKKAEEKGGTIHIMSTEASKELEAFGGIGAILRYQIK